MIAAITLAATLAFSKGTPQPAVPLAPQPLPTKSLNDARTRGVANRYCKQIAPAAVATALAYTNSGVSLICTLTNEKGVSSTFALPVILPQ